MINDDDDIITVCEACKLEDFAENFGPRCVLICACCTKEWHISCFEKAREVTVSEDIMDPSVPWYCSAECMKVACFISSPTLVRKLIKGDCQVTIIPKYSPLPDSQEARREISAALSILKSCFTPIWLGNGIDLVEAICKSLDAESIDLSNFRVFAIVKGMNTVTVATVRIFGPNFAEIPLIATKKKFQKMGFCKMLLMAIIEFLDELEVKRLIIPSVKETSRIWEDCFGFTALDEKEKTKVEGKIICPDSDCCTLLGLDIPSKPTKLTLPFTAQKIDQGLARLNGFLREWELDELRWKEWEDNNGSYLKLILKMAKPNSQS